MRPLACLFLIVIAASSIRLEAGVSRVGLNGNSCSFPDISSAIEDAQPGDAIFVEVGTYSERLVIGQPLQFYAALDGCTGEDMAGRVVIDGTSLPVATSGGLVRISNGGGALFVRFDLRNGQAESGGIAAVSQDSDLVLRDSTLANGLATGSGGGGCLLLEDAFLGMDTNSLIVGCSASNGPGGGVRAIESTLSLTGPGSIGFLSDGNSAAGSGGGIHATDSTISAQGFVMLANQSADEGGAIFADSSTLDFDSCDISFNEATNNGGALRLLGATTTAEFANTSLFENATIQFSSNAGGGAIHASGGGAVTMTDSGLVNNSSANIGGGVVVRQGTDLLAIRTTFQGNQATSIGGAIYAAQSSSSVILEDTHVAQNIAGNQGGGLYSAFTPVTMARTTFESNSAGGNGGGAALVLIDDPVSMHNVRMVANGAGGDGGALFLNQSSVELLEVLTGPMACDTGSLDPGEQCAEFSGNNAGERGGAVAVNQGNLTIDSGWILDNTSGTTGGAIWATEALLEFDSTRVEGNQSLDIGGAIHLEDAGGGVDTALLMHGGRIAANQTTQLSPNAGGGGVYLNFADAEFVDVTIEDNQAIYSGGFLHGRNTSRVNVTGGSIIGNTSNFSGGAFYLAQSGSSLVLEGTLLAANQAGTSGGAIQATFTPVTIRDVLITGNSAARGGGAFLWVSDGNEFTNTRLIGNSATEVGGGLYLREADLTLRSLFNGPGACHPADLGLDEYCTEIRGNSADESGGGIYLDGDNSSVAASPSLQAEGVAFIDNHAGLSGAALQIEDSSPDSDQDGPSAELVNVLIKENSDETLAVEAIRVGEDAVVLLDSMTLVANHGAALIADGDDFELTVRNSLIWENSDGPFASFTGTLDRSCTNIQSGPGGGHFFGTGTDPLFVATSRGPYRLDPDTSPLIDLCPDGPAWDLDGGVRPGRQAFDIGAFEVDAGVLGAAIFRDRFESGQ